MSSGQGPSLHEEKGATPDHSGPDTRVPRVPGAPAGQSTQTPLGALGGEKGSPLWGAVGRSHAVCRQGQVAAKRDEATPGPSVSCARLEQGLS